MLNIWDRYTRKVSEISGTNDLLRNVTPKTDNVNSSEKWFSFL